MTLEDLALLSRRERLRVAALIEIDAALFVGGTDTLTIQQALRDPVIKLMSLGRADADSRRFPFLTKLTLPSGTIDLGVNIPDHDIAMVGTKAMLGRAR